MRVDASDKVLHVLGYAVRIFVYISLILPIVIIIGASVTAGNMLVFPPEGFSLRWYEQALGSRAFMESLWISARLALLSTAVSLTVGFLASMAIVRNEFTGRSLLQSLSLSPLVVPTVVLGLALLQFLAWVGWQQTFLGLFLGHLLVTLPYVVRILSSNLMLFDKTLEEAAMSLRASPAKTLRRITLPLLVPALLTAAIFAFVTSFGNVTLSIFLSFGNEVTLPVQILTYVEYNLDPLIAAISTLVIIVTLLIILIIERLIGVERTL